MSNNMRRILVLAAALASIPGFPCHADQITDKVFAKLETQALQQWHQKPLSDSMAKRINAIEKGKLLKADIQDLSPEQLVALIKSCRQKIHEIPSDSKHERYFDYFEQAINFSLRRLGELDTTSARKALDDVKPIIAGTSSLMLTWDEVKAKQKSK